VFEDQLEIVGLEMILLLLLMIMVCFLWQQMLDYVQNIMCSKLVSNKTKIVTS